MCIFNLIFAFCDIKVLYILVLIERVINSILSIRALSMTAYSRTLLYGPAFLVAMLILTMLVIRPVWQIHDDAYYAMLADGYGIVTYPVEAVPYMHPIIGEMLGLIRSIGVRHSYTALLLGCILLGAGALTYRLIRDGQGLTSWLFVSTAIALVILQLQYTYVSGFLVACAAVLWVGRGETRPTLKEWVFGALLILMAMFFRMNMAVVALACLLPVLVWDARSRHVMNNTWIVGFLSAAATVVLLYVVASHWLADTRLEEFYRLNSPMAKLMNYGYIEALVRYDQSLPMGYTENDIALLSDWFFGDLDWLDPARVNALVESVPLEHVLKVRYRTGIEYIKGLPGSVFFWFLLCTIWLSFFSRLRIAILLGVGAFVAFNIASALLLKPFPERVAGAIIFGLFLLSIITFQAIPEGRTHRLNKFALFVAAALLAPVAISITNDRLQLRDDALAWIQDIKVLEPEGKIYAFPGKLPLRAGYRPFEIDSAPPRVVFMGSMYLLPELRDEESDIGCGDFIGCLSAGKRTALVASPGNVEKLQQLVRERHGRELVVENKIDRPSFTLYILSVRVDNMTGHHSGSTAL